MGYELTQGPTEQAILRQCIRDNKPYPKAIADAPDLDTYTEFYYFAWVDLGSCRNYEGGEIPWTALREYAKEYDLDEDQRVILYNVIRTVDIWFLSEIQKRADKKTKHGKVGSNRQHEGRVKKVLPLGSRR